MRRMWPLGLFVLFLTACGQNQEPAGFYVDRDTAETSYQEAAPMEKAQTGYQETSYTPGKSFKPFPIYTDANSPDNHFAPSGWMGDYSDLSLDDAYFTDPHGGTTSIKITYNNKATQGARWAGIFWQNPPNNWGNRPGGFDLTGAKRFVFWAKGALGGERIEEFKVGGITGEYSDSDIAGIGPVVLTPEWKEYVIDLDGRDLTYISGGFAWAANLDGNPEGFTIFLDDMRFE